MNFNGKVALVTGAASGIGRAVAHKLAQNGGKLILVDINISGLEAVKEELEQYSTEALIYHCDISDELTVNEVVKKALEHFGKIDILVNNAALFRCWGTFLDTDVEDWKKYLNVNVMGTVYFTKAVLGQMLENGFGRIINVASVAGVYGNANMVHYSATKGAIIAFTKALAKEVTDKGVLVNSVSPGNVSPSENSDLNHYNTSQLAQELAFMGRTGSHMENANLICFLASDEASYISGQNVQIDGCRKKM